ncbi:MAG: BirA family transcriptional regulator [Acidobacteriota bacterium]|nr:BirA family transcriptional regulator [Acidobacteriota bacterium]
MRDSFQVHILSFDSLPSTNTEAARQAAAGAREGLCVVAREQTAGRGRRERAWASPKDAGLYFSIVLRPTLALAAWPLIPLACALAARDALIEACALETDIKWPNDLLSRGRKLCGILVETCETVRGRACVAGVGVNLRDAAFPVEIAARATSVEAETGRAPDREQLLASLVRCVALRYEELQSHGGPQAIVRAWSAASTYAEGKRVRVALGGAESIEGTTRGLEADGALRIETDDGTTRIVRAGDVTALRQMMNAE